MLRITLFFVTVIGLTVAGPAVMRTKKDIEEFVKFLYDIRNGVNKRIQTQVTASADANVEELSGYFQGDIVLDDVDYETMLQEYAIGRNAYTTSSITTWPDNTVVFEFGAGEFDSSQEAAIWEAIRDIEAHTCVKFRYRTRTDQVYVKITGASDGCYSHIGYRRSRGAHTMNLARNTVGVGCFRHPTIVHEFMHILGFTHMHATYNRDEFVEIVEQNISYGNEHNFDIYTASRINNYGIDYDYVSCLHYGPTSFSRNGSPTIKAKKKYEGEMGQRQYVTDSDWLRIKRHYNCPGAWN